METQTPVQSVSLLRDRQRFTHKSARGGKSDYSLDGEPLQPSIGDRRNGILFG